MRREWMNGDYEEMLECIECGRNYDLGEALDLNMKCEECARELIGVKNTYCGYNNIDSALERGRY